MRASRGSLLSDLQGLVRGLADDLRDQSTEDADVVHQLRAAHKAAKDGRRTAQAFVAWRDDFIEQVAVAWVLACVFVRYLEDNEWIDASYIAGHGDRGKRADDAHEAYFREHPHDSDPDYFQSVFRKMQEIPAARELFLEGKTPLWALKPSGDGGMMLRKLFQEVDPETGELLRDFRVEGGDTRFLGDLYQDLSEHAKKKYALLQTPEFVEEFILDYTLTPAIETFGLADVRLIDPTCGSGHFLLGAFHRLFDLWCRQEPGGNKRDLAQRALGKVHGVDVNPFATAIAKFRLVIAAEIATKPDRRSLEGATAWSLNVATGDSLLHGLGWLPSGQQLSRELWLGDEEEWAPAVFALEDGSEVRRILGQSYHAVVGNPPYITVKDKALNQAYRELCSSCHRQYSLGVPFTERFFRLAQGGVGKAGYVGMITANSFMKREFGKKLIEDFFPTVDLTHVIDTSGAYIPGHGTPTVILFGQNHSPQSTTVRAALGIRGEPSTPADPKQGRVWQSIVENIASQEVETEFVSFVDVERVRFATHPWSIGGGGASALKEALEAGAGCSLSKLCKEIGFGVVTREDDAYRVGRAAAIRFGVSPEHVKPLVAGEEIRDWSIADVVEGVWPYDPASLEASGPTGTVRYLWPLRAHLRLRPAYGKTQVERGLEWFEYSMFFKNRYRTPLSIAFAFVASHNHFVLDRGGKVFKQSAPIIKLPPDATEDDHLALLGLLNSSTACFWMKQVFFPKGGDTVGTEGARVRKTQWDERYEFAGTQLLPFPVCRFRPIERAQELDRLATSWKECEPSNLLLAEVEGRSPLDRARARRAATRRLAISQQEELDWAVYSEYGIAETRALEPGEAPEIELGQRAFEIVLARRVQAGDAEPTWFERHGSTPITELPAEWPEHYRDLVEERIRLIESDQNIRLLEQPEYKRRWGRDTWDEELQSALRDRLLDRLEERQLWDAQPSFRTAHQLANALTGDREFQQLAGLYRGRDDFNLPDLVSELVAGESVPFLPALRYKPSGLRKREAWEETWELQRREDAGETIDDISVPPKYASSDFRHVDYWRLRGKLDVPKERFISYPHCERATDPSLVVFWAGYDHLQQAKALATYYQEMKDQEGWEPARLVPLLLGLDQLVPWLRQWHNDVDPETGLHLGDYFYDYLQGQARELGFSVEELQGWEPPKRAAKRRKKSTKRRSKKTPAPAEDE